MAQDVKPTFVGSQQEIELAGRVFDLMIMQGRFFSSDAPIKQTLATLAAYLVESGAYADGDEMAARIDAALKRNPQVFYREERDGEIVYTTTKKGSYRPPVRMRSGPLPIVTSRHIAAPQRPAPAATVHKRATIIKHGASISPDLLEIVRAQSPVLPPPPADVRLPAPPTAEPSVARVRATAPAAAHKPKPVPQIVTPQGLTINMSKSPAEILAKYADFFTNLVRDRLATDDRFVSFGNQWMLADQMTTIAKGELRQVREFIETSGGPEADDSLCSNIFRRDPVADPAFRFALNYHLATEKKVFEFVGSKNQNLWWILGAQSPRIVRAPLKPAEVGQDLKYLEDEAPVAKLQNNKWVHTLTFYEWENGILPYSPEAKLVLPPPMLKDQKIAQLRFEAPQFGVSAYVELHYPTGNRGGWIEGLGEILVVFISGARLTIARDPDKIDTFSITYDAKPAEETTVLLYDGKRQRFVFQPLPLNYRVDNAYLLERQRFAGLKDVRRLDEAARRKSDSVIIFAFEKIGAKVTRDEKTVYRARIDDILPVINIEKPFSTTSLLRFFATHPHYQKDEAEEGYYFYIPD